MFGNRGIPAKDLRPFSIEDPFGQLPHRPAEERLKRRMRKTGPPRPSHETHPAQTRRHHARTAPSPAVANIPRPHAPVASEKSNASGCLTVLVVLGLLYGAGSLIVPYVWGLVEQKLLLVIGTRGVGKVVAAKATDSEVNDETVYEVTVEVIPDQGLPYRATVEQALASAEAQKLRPGVWVSVRVDSDDPSKIVLVQVDIPAPEPPAPADVQPTTDQIILKRLDPASPTGEEPAAADPTAPQDPSDAPHPSAPGTDQGETMSTCTKARNCCIAIGGSSCAHFADAQMDTSMCATALQGFSQLAAAMGKSCEPGAP